MLRWCCLVGAGIFPLEMPIRRRSAWVLRGLPPWLIALGLALLLISCGGAPRKDVEAAPVEAPRPRNAAAIAQAIAAGKVSMLVYAERTRGHPVAERIAALELWGPVLEGTGIDPKKDLARAFVTAPSVRAEREAVAVLEHTLSAEKLSAGLDALRARSDPPAEDLQGLGLPAMKVTIQGHTRVIATVEPSFLVVLPEAKAAEARRFAGTGGFPDPTGQEAAIATAIEPSRTLKAANTPRVPETIRSLEAKITLAKDGGADVALDGASASPEQAQADAQELTEAVDRATSLRVSIVKLRLFDPVKFSAEGDRVKARRHVTPGELDRLFGLLVAVLPR
jgi:hypothetical protein